MSDFVKPEIERLYLTDGQFIDVKKRLTHGEREDMFAAMSPMMMPGEPLQLNRRHVRTSKVVTYLVGWSLTDEGKPVPMSPDLPEQARIDTLRSLSPERFTELYDAILTHEEAREQAMAAAKKIRDGETKSSAILPSPASMAGATSGLDN